MDAAKRAKALPAKAELDAGERGFAEGLLVDLVALLRTTRAGDLIAITTGSPAAAADLASWARFTGNAVVQSLETGGRTRFVVRSGAAPAEEPGLGAGRVGSRLWLYTNFDCNLACDYCCVRSSPRAERRELGLARVEQVVREAGELGVAEVFVTGGEPFLLPDIAATLAACAAAFPVTCLTNGMLFKGAKLESLRALPRDRVSLQVSLDSPSPPLHDLHRGAGTWERAWRGIRTARDEGFRVRIAATVDNEENERRFREFLDAERVAEDDRVVRRVALRGLAQEGVAVTRSDLVPEVTITANGVFWHPVGADDEDLLVTRAIFPLADAFREVERLVAEDRRFDATLASVFHCA